MVLVGYYDSDYLNKNCDRIRDGSHIFLYEDDPTPQQNGPILTITKIIKFVISSATEAKLAATFITTKKMVPLCQKIFEIRWTQPSSSPQIDNFTSAGVTNNAIVPSQTKDMDMPFYWLRYHAAQDKFRFNWAPGDSTGATKSPIITRHCTTKPTNIPTLTNPYLTHIIVGCQFRNCFSPIFIFIFTSMVTILPLILQGCVVPHLVHNVVCKVQTVARGYKTHVKLTCGALTPLNQWIQ